MLARLGIVLALALCSGCPPAEDDPASPVDNLHPWGALSLAGCEGGLYGETAQPYTQYQPLTIWFPNGWDGTDEDTHLTLLCQQEQDSRVVGAPCSHTLTYDAALNVYRGFVTPSDTGRWHFEVTLTSPDIVQASHVAARAQQAGAHPRTVALNTSSYRQVLTVLEPIPRHTGSAQLRLGIWRPSNGRLYYEPDTTLDLSVQVFQTPSGDESNDNTAPSHLMEEIYEGIVHFPEEGTWGVTLANTNQGFSDTLTTFYFAID